MIPVKEEQKQYIETDKTILDACCGGRMFWFDKADPNCIYIDIRTETHDFGKSGTCKISPDILADFRDLPFRDETFYHIVFDPPHLTELHQKNTWLEKKYGILSFGWRQHIKQGFNECWRVLKHGGTLVFKWNEICVPLKEVIQLAPTKPIYGNRQPHKSKTHWITFFKEPQTQLL